MADSMARGAQAVDEREYFVYRFHHRVRVEELRSDMTAYSGGHQVRERSGAVVDGLDVLYVDAELVVAQAGGYIRMRRGVHIRIHAHGEFGFHAHSSGQGVDQREL